MFALIIGVIAPMDILRKEPYGTQLWIESCPDVETAKGRIKVLAASKPEEAKVGRDLLAPTGPNNPLRFDATMPPQAPLTSPPPEHNRAS